MNTAIIPIVIEMKELSLFDLGLNWKSEDNELSTFKKKDESIGVYNCVSEKLFPFDDDEVENIKIKKNPKKVIITIDDNENNIFTGGDDVGKHFISVDLDGYNYGGGHPCITDEQIINSINHFKEWAIREGDIPVVQDKRKRNSLIQHLGGN